MAFQRWYVTIVSAPSQSYTGKQNMTFAIVTDSTCDLPPEIVKKRQIHIIPQYVIFGTQSYKDGIEISSEEFYRRLQTEKNIHPKTSQPTPGDFAEAYQQAKDAAKADQVLGIVVSQ